MALARKGRATGGQQAGNSGMAERPAAPVLASFHGVVASFHAATCSRLRRCQPPSRRKSWPSNPACRSKRRPRTRRTSCAGVSTSACHGRGDVPPALLALFP